MLEQDKQHGNDHSGDNSCGVLSVGEALVLLEHCLEASGSGKGVSVTSMQIRSHTVRVRVCARYTLTHTHTHTHTLTCAQIVLAGHTRLEIFRGALPTSLMTAGFTLTSLTAPAPAHALSMRAHTLSAYARVTAHACTCTCVTLPADSRTYETPFWVACLA
jgi:hypothetical protein